MTRSCCALYATSHLRWIALPHSTTALCVLAASLELMVKSGEHRQHADGCWQDECPFIRDRQTNKPGPTCTCTAANMCCMTVRMHAVWLRFCQSQLSSTHPAVWFMLQVHSRLHRQKLLRAMQRLLLGLGSPPGPVDLLSCSISNTNIVAAQHTAAAAGTASSVHGRAGAGAGAAAPAAVVCTWKPPADLGQPVLHKYLLQRLDHSAPAAAWQTVADLQDSSSMRFRDVPPQPGVYQYRLAVSSHA